LIVRKIESVFDDAALVIVPGELAKQVKLTQAYHSFRNVVSTENPPF